MRNITVTFIGLLFGMLMACTKSEVDSTKINATINAESMDEYLVFGQVGLGWGCRVPVIYLLTNDKLYADTSRSFCKNQEEYVFVGYQLPASEHDKLKGLFTTYPTELRNLETKTIGCPGCADGGMLLIQQKFIGKKQQTFRIDDNIFYRETDVTGQQFPVFLVNYGKAIGSLLTEINYK
jgi:hypothetical protein